MHQNSGSGRVQVAQSGSAALPPRTGRACPQPAHVAHRRWQPLHHGWPLAIEISHGADRPQIEHDRVGSGRQFWQSGPSGVRTDRQSTAARGAALLVGGVGDQAVGTQRLPALVPGSGLLDGSAARAGLSSGPGEAVAAMPPAAEPSVQTHDSVAAGAGRPRDHLCSGLKQLIDQSQHACQRCLARPRRSTRSGRLRPPTPVGAVSPAW